MEDNGIPFFFKFTVALLY